MKRALAERAKLAEATRQPGVGLGVGPASVAVAVAVENFTVPKKTPPAVEVVSHGHHGHGHNNVSSNHQSLEVGVGIGIGLNAMAVKVSSSSTSAVEKGSNVVSVVTDSNAVNQVVSTPRPIPTPTTTARGAKRRKQQPSSDEEAGEPDGWFLKFQNKALVAELRSLQSELKDLTRERNARRVHSLTAVRGMHMVELRWREMEEVLRQLALSVLQQQSQIGGSNFQLSDTDRTILQQVRKTFLQFMVYVCFIIRALKMGMFLMMRRIIIFWYSYF